jgi:hypothetical protein
MTVAAKRLSAARKLMADIHAITDKEGITRSALHAMKKTPVVIAALALVIDLIAVLPARAQLMPDLTVKLRPEFPSVAVGADLRFVGQVSNVGLLPCNRLSVTATFPPQVTSIGAFSNVSAVVCSTGSTRPNGSTSVTCSAGTNFWFGDRASTSPSTTGCAAGRRERVSRRRRWSIPATPASKATWPTTP